MACCRSEAPGERRIMAVFFGAFQPENKCCLNNFCCLSMKTAFGMRLLCPVKVDWFEENFR